MRDFPAVVIGVSAGGLDALQIILPALPADLPRSVIVASIAWLMPILFWLIFLMIVGCQ